MKVYKIEKGEFLNYKQIRMYMKACIICNTDYNVGTAPSVFVSFKFTTAKEWSLPKNRHYLVDATHCDWVCSPMCAEIWIVREKAIK